MVARLIARFTSSTYSMHTAALLLAALSLFAQILAVVRDKMLAHSFGAGVELSMYYASFRIPDMVYASLSSLMAAIVILPVLTSAYAVSADKAKKVIDSLCTVFVCVGIVFVGALYVTMPYLVHYIVPGFTETEYETVVSFSRILLLSPLLLGISNLIGTVLQLKKQFIFYALAPVMYNLGIILAVIFFVPAYGIDAVLYGVIFGAVLHLLIQLPQALKNNLAPKFTLGIDWLTIKEVFFVSIPRMLTLFSIQIAQTFLVAKSTFISVGSAAVFTLAFNVQTVPLTLIGLSYSVAAFPLIAEYVEKKEWKTVWGHLFQAMRHIIFWSIPIMCFFIVLRAHIVRALYGSGEFDWTDTRLTAATLAIMSIALTFQTLSLLAMRALYALQSAYSQLWSQLGAMVVTYIVAVYGTTLWVNYSEVQFFFESLFRVEGLPHTRIIIIGLAHALGAITLTVCLLVLLKKHLPYTRFRDLRTVIFQAFAASILGSTVTYGILSFVQQYITLETFWGVIGNAFLGVSGGGLAWFVILYILGSTELQEFMHALKKRFWKEDIVQEELREL